ncbi:C39 family peptidase [Candidatus Enterococcus mansonii]|uniref:Peptidase C39-like domain-containing protein n=1 Tax=Candidatus Enterococcus mansonii TaxID=1834181 RepID=A0A242CCD6_9ENTE|nr:C39 family peptidase [Enterococcus sp. 4G2_DIV0659]OTO07856.1 hypothetical protein A5880_002126 [Enterococcus sp. 4G2_DIV0659]
MKQKKNEKSKIYIIALLIITTFAGALLAKIAPMEEGHGFSAMFTDKKDVKTTETTTTSEKKQEKVKQLTYAEQINQEMAQGKFANRMPIKLLLQTDDRWKATPYGTGNPKGDTIEINGCAIVSLAMVSSYLDNKDYTPQDILNWSKNDYYMEGEGTAWVAFSDFAMMKGYQFEDLEMDITAVEEQLKQNHPVIVSVKPGLFTETGHIMVLSGTNNGKFWVNDPNDSEAKGHSKKEFTAEELTNEAVNFWTIYK